MLKTIDSTASSPKGLMTGPRSLRNGSTHSMSRWTHMREGTGYNRTNTLVMLLANLAQTGFETGCEDTTFNLNSSLCRRGNA